MSCYCSPYSTYIGSINCPGIPLPNLGIPCCGPTTSPFPSGQGPSGCSNGSGLDASCITYSGPTLNCSGIVAGETLDVILGQIDSQLCSVIGSFTSYNTGCLAPINTLQQFVETISSFVCTLNTNFNTFVDTTFPSAQGTQDVIVQTIVNPGLNLCSASGIVPTDSLNSILTKLANSVCDIYNNQLSLTTVNWSQCFTVSPSPTSIAQGFNVVLNQICQLNSLILAGGASGLPTFNTSSSCLPSGQPNDSLVSVVNKLITQVCACPTFNINTLTWNCVTKPSIVTTDLQDAFQALMTKVDYLCQNLPAAFSGDFILTNIGSPCQGKTVALATPSSQDRFVAATSADNSPGTLQQKLVAGTNITIDYTTDPGQAIINSSAAPTSNYIVAASSTDPSPSFLINKVEAGATVYGITVTPQIDNTTNTVQFNVSVDPNALFTALLNALTTNPTLYSLFCTSVANCPNPCSAPTGVSVLYVSGTTTSTTTTTTTTV